MIELRPLFARSSQSPISTPQFACLGLLIAFLALLHSGPAGAAGTVGTGDPASCTEGSFDAALVGGGIVNFDCGGPATIVFTSAKNIAIDTIINGSAGIVLSGDFSVNLFEVAGGDLEINGLVLANGRDSMAAPGSAAIDANGQTVIIRDSEVRGHVTSEAGCPAINIIEGGLVILRSTFHRNINQAAATGHPICINNGSTATISSSTITDNTGGSLRSSGAMTVLNSTIADNRGTGGNDAGPSAFGASGVITLINTLVADNEGGQCSATSGGQVNDGGGNRQFPDADCGATIPVMNPGLAPLADNGGPTPTMAIAFPSPAIDSAIQGACPATDQRGEVPADGDGNGSVLCDAGAYEATAVVPPTAIPTVNSFGLVALSILLCGMAWRRLGP